MTKGKQRGSRCQRCYPAQGGRGVCSRREEEDQSGEWRGKGLEVLEIERVRTA